MASDLYDAIQDAINSGERVDDAKTDAIIDEGLRRHENSIIGEITIKDAQRIVNSIEDLVEVIEDIYHDYLPKTMQRLVEDMGALVIKISDVFDWDEWEREYALLDKAVAEKMPVVALVPKANEWINGKLLRVLTGGEEEFTVSNDAHWIHFSVLDVEAVYEEGGTIYIQIGDANSNYPLPRVHNFWRKPAKKG